MDFPSELLTDTICGGTRTRMPRHSTYSASTKQTNYLAALARTNGYDAPHGTCCSNQASTLIHELKMQLVGLRNS